MDQQQVDVSKLSDQELMALIGQPNQAQPATPQQAPVQQAPSDGLGPYQQPVPVQQQSLPDISQPREQGGEDFLDGLDKRVRALARGVPVAGAAADEANAAILAGVAPYVEPLIKNTPLYDPKSAIGDLPSYGDRYDAALNLQRFRDDQYDTAHPVESNILKGVGLVGGALAGARALTPLSSALPATAGLLPRVGAGLLEGGAIGGAQGYAEGQGDWTDPSRLAGATKGGVVGGVVGGALPVGLAAGGALWRNTGQKAIDAVRQALPGAKTESQALAEAIKGTAPAEAPITGNAAPDLTEAVSSAAKPVAPSQQADAYSRLAQALERQRQTPEEMAARVSGLGPNAMIADTGDAVRTLGRDAFNRPSGAEDIIRKALEARQRGVMVDGEFTAQPSSGRILSAASDGLGVSGKEYHGEIDDLLASRKAAADPAYAKMREAAPVDIGELRDFTKSSMFRSAYDRAQRISEKEFVTLPDGSEGIVPLPQTPPDKLDWRTLDLIKQGMDDVIATSPLEGIGNTERGAAKGYMKRFVDKLDALNPDYKPARDAFSGPTAIKSAIEDGKNALREDAPVLAKRINEMSPSEQEGYRLGIYQGLKSKVGDSDVTFDAARRAGLLKPNQLERFKEAFPDRSAFAKFVNLMANEQRMFETRSALIGNSTTAKQLAAMQENDSPLEEGLKTAAEVATLHPMAIVRALGRFGGETKMSPATAESLASILTNTDQSQLPIVVQHLTEAQKRRALAEAVRAGTTAGAEAGAASAAQPNR